MNDLHELEACMFRADRLDFLELNPKQLDAIKVLRDAKTTALVFGGGANGGKSWLGCTWLLESCLAYPGTKYFVGRESLKDLRKSTYPTLLKVARHRMLDRSEYSYNGQDHFVQFENGSRIDFIELAHLPSDPDFERYGSTEYTAGWIEEGSQVERKAFTVLQTRVCRWLNDQYGLTRKVLVTCNPRKNWLYLDFWKPFKDGTLPSHRRFIQSLVDDNPRRESGSKEALEQIEDPVTKQRLLFGNWDYEDDPAALMNYDAIIGIYTNHHVKPDEANKYITADIARMGRDHSYIRVWYGWVVVKTLVLAKTKTPEVEGAIIGLANNHGVQRRNIAIDEDGVGGGVLDHIPGARGFINGSKPLEVNGEVENYANLKSQCSFRFAQKVNAGEALILDEEPQHKTMTIEEMEQVKRRDPDSDGKIAVIKKEDFKAALGRSPDSWDSLMMRALFDIPVPRSKTFNQKPPGW